MAYTTHYGDFMLRTHGWLSASAILKGGICRFDIDSGWIEPAVIDGVSDQYMYGVNQAPSQTALGSGVTKTEIVVFASGQIWAVDTTSTLTQTCMGTAVSHTDTLTIDEDDTANWPTMQIIDYLGVFSDKKALVMPIFAGGMNATSGISRIGFKTS